jgi:hypothetical protein
MPDVELAERRKNSPITQARGIAFAIMLIRFSPTGTRSH